MKLNTFVSDVVKIYFLSALFNYAACQDGNSPPTWDTDSYTSLTRGILEDTPLGTTVARLRCNDPENDPIDYGKKAGDAFSVTPSGDVILSKELDFDVIGDDVGSDLEFFCVDLDVNNFGTPLHPEVTTRIQFSINDANDNFPIFDTGSAQDFEFSIDEDLPVGSVLMPALSINDRDRAENAELDNLYFICETQNPLSNQTFVSCSFNVFTLIKYFFSIYAVTISYLFRIGMLNVFKDS